jgi:nucleoside-diphosphate-sugar epimerase
MCSLLLLLLGCLLLLDPCLALSSSSAGKAVAVLGGSGFVGSRVCQQLASQGATVTSISKSGKPPKWALQQDWTNQVTWKSVDLLSATEEQLDACLGSPTAVISCVGTIGTDPDRLLQGNGMANVRAFESAKRIGTVQSVAYVSVSSEVAACKDNWLPEFFASYFHGKDIAETAAQSVCNDVTLVRPTFIYGGDSFGLLPPRVNAAYGSFIDQLLSFGLIQKVADITPGLIKVALRPPVSVDSVAGACISAGSGVRVLDSAAAINQASGQPPATGVQDAIEWTVETTGKIVEWVQAKAKQIELDGAKK